MDSISPDEKSVEIVHPPTPSGRDYTEELLLPVLLIYMDFQSLMTLVTLNKRFHKLIEDENSALGFWPALCNSFCAHAGLYSPVIINPENIIARFNYRKHFFDELWILRHKWSTTDNMNLSYKVRVSCRFRPGEPPTGRVCLPLHQFVRLRRQKKIEADQQNKNQATSSNTETIFVGEKDPEEFCDPLLGSLMREPVLLTSSGRIVDRTVAVQCIHRGGRDPFNGKRLTAQMLTPQPELAARIQAWRERPERTDISLDIKDVKGLVDTTSVNQDFLEALLEVERMQNMIKKATKLDHMREAGVLDDANALADDLPNAAGQDPATNNQEINPDITVGLVDADVDDAHDNNPFSIQNLMHSNAQFNPLFSLQQQQEGDAASNQNKKNEIARVVEVNEQANFVSMHVPGTGVRPFHFSNVYSPQLTQEMVYEKTARDSVEAALNGCNACVLCYGQTGSGKTYSFLGPEGTLAQEERNQSSSNNHNNILPQSGMLLRAAADFFRARDLLIQQGNLPSINAQGQHKKNEMSVNVNVQIVEVYEEKVTDLMTGKVVSVRRDTGHIAHGSEHPCENLQDFLSYYQIAHGRQRFAETAMNERSSRAHTLVIFQIAQKRSSSKATTAASDSSSAAAAAAADTDNEEIDTKEELLVNSQLYLVDLAGSERVKKSKVSGLRLREAVGINSSLLVLGKVISALVEGESHVPYLESKLTTLLKAAFGGNARTMVLINTRTEEEHGDETLQSLRFGERCGLISNSLKQVASSFASTLQVMDDAISQLEAQLQSLSQRKKQHLESFKTLQQSYEILLRKRQELLTLNNHHPQKNQTDTHNAVAKKMKAVKPVMKTSAYF